ncbi:MAG: type II toxin-antitoxin system HicB family antitoxin [Faecalimonas sp.]|nr:type II toxin-antitoxin system HicB family antitoxin [Faecalimonas sp.]
MNKYVYPAVFTPEDDGGYSVNFPDLEGCYTCGDDLADALLMAQDVLALTMYGYEHEQKVIPTPTSVGSIKISDKEFVNLISADTMTYRKMYNNKAIKKTLSIPEWLNEAATAMNLNFSQVLQEALMQKVDKNL